MFSAFLNSWKIPELRRRILFTLGIIALARVGANIPCPGVDPSALNAYIGRIQSQVGGSFVGLAMLMTGGGLQNCAVFALGVMPYISGSIIMTLLTAVIPSFERLRQEGESGRAKIIQYGRYLTVLICIIQGFFKALGGISAQAQARRSLSNVRGFPIGHFNKYFSSRVRNPTA